MKIQRPGTLVSVPVLANESLEDYISRAGQIALENNQAICKTIDHTIGKGYRSQSTIDNPKVTANTINARYNARKKTLADIAAENPLIAEMLRAGF